MLNKQEKLFVKCIVNLEFEKYKGELIKEEFEELESDKERWIDYKAGYEIMTPYDTSCTFWYLYPESRKFITEEISKYLPKKLREKIQKEHIDLADYWNDMFDYESDFTEWWNSMRAWAYMEYASKYFDTVEEVNSVVQPDMNYWGGEDKDLQKAMDDQTKRFTIK